MNIQTIELRGERYVIIPGRQFLDMRHDKGDVPSPEDATAGVAVKRFKKVVPLRVGGMPISELVIRDRQ